MKLTVLKINTIKPIKNNPFPFFLILVLFFFVFSNGGNAQQIIKAKTDSVPFLTLDQCISYALNNQPVLKETQLNENITSLTNEINLSGRLPQVNLSGNLTHYLQLPTSFANNTTNPGGAPVKVTTGVKNTLIPVLSVNQTIFNPSLVLAGRTADLYSKQATQITDSTKINIISTVSKSFFSLLLTLEQINVLKEDTARLNKNVKDSYHQYIGGIVDETDYESATITLNNSKSQLKQAIESVRPQYAVLKQLMGFAPENEFNVSFDTVKMMQEIAFDTTQLLQYERRIEFQQLYNNRKIQQQLTGYYKRAYEPTVSAFFDYFPELQNNSFGSLFNSIYPYSYIGLSFSMPIFTGLSRVKSVQRSRLQERIIDWEEASLKSLVYAQYTSTLANYKSNLYDLNIMRDNEQMAKRVYKVVALQYSQGIVPYLNVVNAESNLITSEIGYLNALFQVLSSKIDLEKAMGLITSNR